MVGAGFREILPGPRRPAGEPHPLRAAHLSTAGIRRVYGAADELCTLLKELSAAVPLGLARANLQRALAQAHEACGDTGEAIAVWAQVQQQLPIEK